MSRLKFAIQLKTYEGNLEFAGRIFGCFHNHNVEDIPLFLVCPRKEITIFGCFLGHVILGLAEESVID